MDTDSERIRTRIFRIARMQKRNREIGSQIAQMNTDFRKDGTRIFRIFRMQKNKSSGIRVHLCNL
jgi:hypothetical protein